MINNNNIEKQAKEQPLRFNQFQIFAKQYIIMLESKVPTNRNSRDYAKYENMFKFLYDTEIMIKDHQSTLIEDLKIFANYKVG